MVRAPRRSRNGRGERWGLAWSDARERARARSARIGKPQALTLLPPPAPLPLSSRCVRPSPGGFAFRPSTGANSPEGAQRDLVAADGGFSRRPCPLELGQSLHFDAISRHAPHLASLRAWSGREKRGARRGAPATRARIDRAGGRAGRSTRIRAQRATGTLH